MSATPPSAPDWGTRLASPALPGLFTTESVPCSGPPRPELFFGARSVLRCDPSLHGWSVAMDPVVPWRSADSNGAPKMPFGPDPMPDHADGGGRPECLQSLDIRDLFAALSFMFHGLSRWSETLHPRPTRQQLRQPQLWNCLVDGVVRSLTTMTGSRASADPPSPAGARAPLRRPAAAGDSDPEPAGSAAAPSRQP